MLKKRIIFIYVIILLIFVPLAHSQNWVSLPPYNTLWPLWSPILSPIDATTEFPTPIVSSLNRFTILPYQPALTWDPYMPYPWMLYNTPFGLAFYDVTQDDVFMWPPIYLVNWLTFEPSPISLPSGYSAYPPISTTFLSEYIPLANEAYTDQYGVNAFLLTALQLVTPFW